MSATKKRFTDTYIWDNDWFIELPVKYKLAWFYIKDMCDIAGVWKPQLKKLSFVTGETYDVREIVSALNRGRERIIMLDNGSWLICDFCYFQYKGTLNLNNKAHQAIAHSIYVNRVPILKTGVVKILNAEKDFAEYIMSQNATYLLCSD